jgi:hypothetical protein
MFETFLLLDKLDHRVNVFLFLLEYLLPLLIVLKHAFKGERGREREGEREREREKW